MKKILASVLFALVLCGGVAPGLRAYAESAGCSYEGQQANSLIPVSKDGLTAYVRASLTEDQGPAGLFMQQIDASGEGDCIEIGTVNLTARWQKIGILPAGSAGMVVTLTLTLPDTAASIGAGGPQVVLVGADAPCVLDVACKVNYSNTTLDLSPKKLSAGSDSLLVGEILPIGGDKIKNVIYSIDGKPAYEKKILEAFNEHYVSGGEHTLTRTVVLASGQALSDSRHISKGSIANISYLFQAYLFSQSKVILIVLVFFLGILLWSLVLFILRLIERRRRWRQTHVGGYVPKFDKSKAGAQKNFRSESVVRTIYRYRIVWLGFLGLVIGFLLFTTYIVGSFTVDGVSMLPTLQDKTTHPLIKVQKTLAVINRSEYLPKRGTIVVIQKDENNLFDPTAAQEKSYVVKRVIGLPGERVVVRDGLIRIFNSEHKDGFEPDKEFKWTPLLEGSEMFNIDITLKDSELFVVGDHRNESIDSRFYGPVNTKEVVGKVFIKK